MTKKKVIKRPKKAVIKIVSILVIIFSIYLLIGVGKEVYTTVQLQKRAETAEIELEKLREENASLVSKKGKLEDPNYVQTYARGNYMFSKDGEQIFYLPSDLDREPASTITPTTNPEE